MRINKEENHRISPIPSKGEDVPEYNESHIPVIEERLSINKVHIYYRTYYNKRTCYGDYIA